MMFIRHLLSPGSSVSKISGSILLSCEYSTVSASEMWPNSQTSIRADFSYHITTEKMPSYTATSTKLLLISSVDMVLHVFIGINKQA